VAPAVATGAAVNIDLLQVDALPLGIFERKSAISQDLTESFVQQKRTLLG
jgi:hypothetical protein